mgnify:CR=1 FL=1
MAAKGEREVRIRFTGESAVLKGAGGEVRKVFQMLQGDINDTRSAGEKLATAQKQVADSMRKDMEEIGRAADVVRDSLGPEMTAAIEASGRSVEDQVQEWRKLGLTLDEIKMDSAQLADGMKALDGAARQGVGAVGDGFKKLNTDVDQSRSVMANFVGNAVQEIPLIGGSFGPVNMALGQFAEYAAEGNIKMSKLAAVAGPMGVLAVTISAIADAAAAAAKRSEELRKAQEAIADGEYEQAAADLYEGYGALYRQFDKLGVSADLVTKAIMGNADAQREVLRISSQAEQGNTNMLSGWQQLNEHLKDAAESWVDEGEALAAGNEIRGEVLDTLTKTYGAEEANTGAVKRHIEAQEQAAEKQCELNDARMASIDAGFAARSAQDAYTTSLEDLAAAVDDPKTGVDELRQAQDEAAQAAIGMALANQASAENLSALAGAPLTAAQSHQVLIDTLYKTALALAPDSPLRAQLVEYIGTLQFVPGEVSTTVTANTDNALGRIGGVQSAVDDLGGTSAEAETDAETQTALDKVTTLTGAIDDLDGRQVTLAVVLAGDEDTKTRLSALRTSLQLTIDKANEADRAVARVAG